MELTTSWLEQGIEQGIERGLAQGRQEGERGLVLRLFSRRFGELSPGLRARVQQLALPQLEALSEALLDFNALPDLEHWLAAHAQ